MGNPEVDCSRLGAEVARTFEELAPQRARAVEQARWAFMDTLSLAPQPRRAAPFVLAALAGACVVALALFFGFRSEAPPLTFEVDGERGVARSWLAAQSARPVRLEFSDGTVFQLGQASRARVTEVGRDGAHLSLESGSLHADVVHTGSSHWELVSGPLTVRVTGTRFDLNWNPARQLFSIHVIEGSVAVSGSLVGPERPVRTGEKLLVSVAEQRLEFTRNVTAATARPEPLPRDAEPRSVEPGPAELGSVAPRANRALAEDSAASKKSERMGWRELSARGALREAFAAAEASGFTEACQGASASELLVLGDAARLAGRPERVSEALLSLRKRYPNDSRRAAAAFMLGKVAFDQRRAFAQAATWFSTAIREQPSGSLSREASGRLIEALRAAGDSGAAERAAREYLARYPQGPHAALARSLAR
jgi:hypothetical protein